MILITLNQNKVVDMAFDVNPNEITLEPNQVLIEELPQIELEHGEIARLFYEDNQIIYKKEKKEL